MDWYESVLSATTKAWTQTHHTHIYGRPLWFNCWFLLALCSRTRSWTLDIFNMCLNNVPLIVKNHLNDNFSLTTKTGLGQHKWKLNQTQSHFVAAAACRARLHCEAPNRLLTLWCFHTVKGPAFYILSIITQTQLPWWHLRRYFCPCNRKKKHR